MVPDVPAIHRLFDYAVPDELVGVLQVGSRVRVDLHGRRVAAWVVDVDVTPPTGVAPKPIARWSGDGPPASVVALAEWAAWRWAGPVSSFLGTASPPRVVRHLGAHRPPRNPIVPVDNPVASPGGGSVALGDAVLSDAAVSSGRPSLIRLAPAFDATLVVLEILHRLGEHGVVVLVPSRARAATMAVRLRKAGATVAALPDQWEDARRGQGVVVGTRAGAWAPIDRLRGAVVLDAHDEAYREERTPTWSAVDVLMERARRDGAPAVLVAPYAPVAIAERATVVTTDRATERRGWPVVEVVDRTGDDPRTGLFSDRLARSLHDRLTDPSGRVVCILNRKGRARLLACANCGSLARCARCGGSVAQPEADGPLRCRRCDETRPRMCAMCDSTRLKLVRIGVSRAAEELAALTGVAITEVTGEADGPVADDARLVVGTEAALHRVHRADLVVFLDFDQHLLAPRFTAGEESLALLARAARLVGGRDSCGRVLVQTRLPDHEVIRAATHGDPSLLAEPERELRLALGLPPFGVLASVRGKAVDATDEYIGALTSVGGLSVSSTEPNRWLLKSVEHRTLCDGLAGVPRPPSAGLRIEVDPIDV